MQSIYTQERAYNLFRKKTNTAENDQDEDPNLNYLSNNYLITNLLLIKLFFC